MLTHHSLSFLFSLFILQVRCSLFSWKTQQQIVRFVDQATVVVGDFLYISGGSIRYSTTGAKSYYNRTLRIDLRQSWNNQTVSPDVLPGNSGLYGGQAFFYNSFKNSLYTFDGFVAGKVISPGPPLDVLDLNQSRPSWTRQASQPTISPGVNSLIGATHSRGPDKFFSIGGQSRKGRNKYTQFPGYAQYQFRKESWNGYIPASVQGAPLLAAYQNSHGTYGAGLYIPYFGSRGLFIHIGGQSPQEKETSKKATKDFQSLYYIRLFDPSTLLSYPQNTTGFSGKVSFQYPLPRIGLCMVGALDPVAGGYDIFMYGGAPFDWTSNGTITGEDRVDNLSDVWVLSLPTFTWTRISTPSQSQPRPRAFHSCELVGQRQMVVIGGYDAEGYSNGQGVDVEDPWEGGLGIFDMSLLKWVDRYDPHASPYQRPDIIKERARLTPPVTFLDQLTKPLFAKDLKKASVSSFGTGPIRKNAFSGKIGGGGKTSGKTSTPSSGTTRLNNGALAGLIVSIVVFALIALALLLLIRRRRRRRKLQKSKATDNSPSKSPDIIELEAFNDPEPGIPEMPAGTESHELPPEQANTSELSPNHGITELSGESPRADVSRVEVQGDNAYFPTEKSEAWFKQIGKPRPKNRSPDRFEEVTDEAEGSHRA